MKERPILFSIAGWSDTFENNRTRELKTLCWVPIPNRHDGDGYTTMVDRPNGAALYGAWVAVLQVASKCDPRGTLVREGGKPHDSASLSRMTRLPAEVIEEMLEVALHECKWLEINVPQECATIPQDGAAIPQASALEQKGMEQKGKRESERDVDAAIPTLADVLDHAGRVGVSPDSARRFFDHHEGNGLWLNQLGQLINWRHKLKSWGEKDRTINRNAPRRALEARGPSLSDVMAYGQSKEAPSVWCASFFGYWSKRNWQKAGKSLDWQVEFSEAFARERSKTT